MTSRQRRLPLGLDLGSTRVRLASAHCNAAGEIFVGRSRYPRSSRRCRYPGGDRRTRPCGGHRRRSASRTRQQRTALRALAERASGGSARRPLSKYEYDGAASSGALRSRLRCILGYSTDPIDRSSGKVNERTGSSRRWGCARRFAIGANRLCSAGRSAPRRRGPRGVRSTPSVSILRRRSRPRACRRDVAYLRVGSSHFDATRRWGGRRSRGRSASIFRSI